MPWRPEPGLGDPRQPGARNVDSGEAMAVRRPGSSGGGAERHIANRGIAHGGRDTRERASGSEEGVADDGIREEPRHVNHELAADQPPEACEQECGTPDSRGHIVMLGPRRDRHSAERMSGNYGLLVSRHGRLEHRLQVIPEARE